MKTGMKVFFATMMCAICCSNVYGQELLWGSTDTRYAQDSRPTELKEELALKAWKGEHISAQAVIWAESDMEITDIRIDALLGPRPKGHPGMQMQPARIPGSNANAAAVRYVWTDELNKDRKGGCGHRPNKAEWDSSLVADLLDRNVHTKVKAGQAQPIWVTVDIPEHAIAGRYIGALRVEYATEETGRETAVLGISINVVERALPSPKDWSFHLDLWQNPYSVARYHNVALWSKEHFDLLRPLMKMLADVGQRSITTSIMHKPWNGQTYDPFDSMIWRTHRIDGTWAYDYTVFDRYVEFMMNEVGIDQTISCYTMIPWALRFDYYEQATSRIQFVEAKPGEQAYTDYWLPFLKDFAQHLREKGWFEKTAISMDERPMELMREAIKVIRTADPEYKITLAGGYHPEIMDDLYYLSIPYGQTFPADVLAKRRAEGKISTVYTCCSEAWPNTFTFSEPAEGAWTMVHAVAEDYDGYLRWAVNSWPEDPMHDSRFWSWAAGDTYSIYPGACSSIRFERMREGLQMCEKIAQLRKELKGKRLKNLNKVVDTFRSKPAISTGEAVGKLAKTLNDL